MAIILEQSEKEKKREPINIPLWFIIIVILILVFGTISYFLFFKPAPKVELKEAKDGLTEQELTRVSTMLKEVENPNFQLLTPVIQRSELISPQVDPTRLGNPYPFTK